MIVSCRQAHFKNESAESVSDAKEYRTPTYPWIADQKDGTFCNPVIAMDYSDPDAIRVGDDFYLTASSFNCTPGLPILHSKDLVNWRLINYALKNNVDPRYADVKHGEGVWAPAIRHHDGKYWIFFPTPDEGIYVTTATDPAGQWSEPHLLLGGKGLIDPCPFWDEDGKAYLVHAYAKSRAGIHSILHVRPMSPDGKSILGEGKYVYENPGRHRTLEGPKLYKKDGWYYIFAPAGGVETGWQVVFRSRDIYGPYEDKIVLAQGSTPINGPHQGALVDTQSGEWWFLHFQERLPLGRIVHLQPVEWKDGWPLMGANINPAGVGEPVGRYRKPNVGATHPITQLPTSDEFDSLSLGLQWQWHGNWKPEWYSLDANPGKLRLVAQPVKDANFLVAPNLLLQKLPAVGFTATTKMHFAPQSESERAGLLLMYYGPSGILLQKHGNGFRVIHHLKGKDQVLDEVAGGDIELRADLDVEGNCRVGYRSGGEWEFSPHTFKPTEGRWIGTKIGLFCLQDSTLNAERSSGLAEFDYFRFESIQE